MQNKPNKKGLKDNTVEDDFAAIREVLNGNTSAFGYLQKKYQRIVSSLIRKMIKNEDDVKDLTQETFIKAFNALSSFQFGYTFSSWLYRIASNNCIDFLRKKRFTTISLSSPLPGDDEEHYLEIEDESFQPELSLLSDERREAINKVIASLPENYREIIKLRHEEDMDYKDISVKLNMPLGTVKANLFRARKIMQIEMKKQRHLFVEI
jgi:RNA polymerase sigma-70 factor (ECF subfamily)